MDSYDSFSASLVHVFIQTDTVATIYFTVHFVKLLFEGSVYFFGKPIDINNGLITE